jgi:hypothetical protein
MVNNNDWFTKLKIGIVLLCKAEELLQKEKKELFVRNPWLFTDENMIKWNKDVNTIFEINGKTIESFIKYIDLLESTGKPFNMSNLYDEFDMIKENYVVGLSYFTNVVNYINTVKTFRNTLEEHDKLARFSNKGTECLNIVKMNDEMIKKYRKEWRD